MTFHLKQNVIDSLEFVLEKKRKLEMHFLGNTAPHNVPDWNDAP